MLEIYLGIHLILTAAIVIVGVYGMTQELRDNQVILHKRLARIERRIGVASEYSNSL
jgi:hypothetical protein